MSGVLLLPVQKNRTPIARSSKITIHSLFISKGITDIPFSEIRNLKRSIHKRNTFEYKDIEDTNKKKAPITTVSVSAHAMERWNQRVGPVETNESLTLLMVDLLKQPHRILLLEDGYGLIDQTIVFTYTIFNGLFCITTFFGRSTEMPILSDIKIFKTLKLRVDLQLSKTTLSEQILPLNPQKGICFSGKKSHYVLEFYCVEGKPLYIVSVFSAKGIQVFSYTEDTKIEMNRMVEIAYKVLLSAI